MMYLLVGEHANNQAADERPDLARHVGRGPQDFSVAHHVELKHSSVVFSKTPIVVHSGNKTVR